jgi:hypothetical protein
MEDEPHHGPDCIERMYRDAGVSTRRYGGDLFTTDCEAGRHAWRPTFGANGYPGPPVTCKWCGVERGKP